MNRAVTLFALVALLFIGTAAFLSWNVALFTLNIGILSAIMALGVNMQWGYAGLFSTGIMGSVALGGLAVVIVSGEPVPQAFAAGGWQLIGGLGIAGAIIAAAVWVWNHMAKGRLRNLTMAGLLIGGFFLYRYVFDAGVAAVEAFDPATHGNIGGFGLNSIWAWPVGGAFAALAAWVIGKVALGLRSDYLAIATLGIAEIIVTAMKSEDWMARGVKNFTKLPRPYPVPKEVDMQQEAWFLDLCAQFGLSPTATSTILVQLIYMVMFGAVLLALIWLLERALNSPWGRMLRAIRDNEVSAAAMGKDVTRQHLVIFILGSAVVGLAGAMMTSMTGQLVPGEYSPLRFTFLIWIMVIVGGSGSNWGAVLGGLLVGWLWLTVDNVGPIVMGAVTDHMAEGPLKDHLNDLGSQLRLLVLGVALLLVLRFSPRGLLPEK